MFEVGKLYEVIELELNREGDGEGYYKVSNNEKVAQQDANLVKFESGRILNTTSPLFHSARDIEAKWKRLGAAHDELKGGIQSEPDSHKL